MKRLLVLAAAGLCTVTAAHAQSVSKKYGWDDGSNQTCMEPYAPAVPKAEETNLKQLVEEVKPEIKAFIETSNKYLECLSIQIGKAREVQDEERAKKLVKSYNDNVDYQKSVAGEFNAALEALKEEAGLAGPKAEGTGQNSENGQDGGPAEGSEVTKAASESGEKTAEEDKAEGKKEDGSAN